jgi:hypothetical protein
VTRRPGGTQPESERRRQVVPVRLSAESRAALDALAAAWGLTRSDTVARLVVAYRRQRAVLREVEWHGDEEALRCPSCWRSRHGSGHSPGCRLAAALK